MRLPFFNFPEGFQGLALLLLRLAVTLVLAREAGEFLVAGWELPGAFICLAALLAGIGFLTPVSALLTALAEVVLMILHNSSEEWSRFLVASILIALTVLGPGAYSIDRWLFGRKRLTIGHSAH